MAGNPYKLRSQLIGHEKDVRAVCPAYIPRGAVISASRDVTARVWTQNEYDSGFTEGLCMSGHGNFVAAVVVMPPDDNLPQGIIFTGSFDNDIFAYTLDSPQPQFKLTGHTKPVCSLAVGKFGTLLSGSWDMTAKVWLNKKCVMTLEGHEAAVWAVAVIPEVGLMLTASADRSIKMWRAGKCEKTFLGHDDCVRGLAVISPSEFLSCSNDATVRRWLTSGDCTHTYYGHTNFVYSIALLPNGEDFISGGEDRTLRVWRNGECEQTVNHPTQSVWCVSVLPDGDIVTGASDGIVRVFTQNEQRVANPEECKAFDDMVANSAIQTQAGDIKPENLASKEALLNPGNKDGQILMVKDEGKIIAHQWNASDGEWKQVGEVVGSSGDKQASSGKVEYEGQVYDYVFDVDLDDGPGANLKLPYNISEDPWFAAQRFIHKNELSQLFLDQIAKFIVDSTKGVTLGETQSASCSDPLTGAGRYVPGSAAPPGAPVAGQRTHGTDPFTGAGSYRPATEGAPASGGVGQTAYGADPLTGSGSYKPGSAPAAKQNTGNQFFPKTLYFTFDTIKVDGVLGKLKNFNAQAQEGQKLDENELTQIEGLLKGDNPTAPHLDSLWRILHWPKEFAFPPLDCLRLVIRNQVVNQHFCNEKDGQQFLNHLLGFVSPDNPPANQMLALRTLTNCFVHSPGERLLTANRDQVITAAMLCKDSANKNVHVAISSILLNFAVRFYKDSDIEAKSQCISAVATLFESQPDPEADFRLLVCTGTLIWGDSNCAAMAKSLDMGTHIRTLKFITDPRKVSECAQCVLNCLQSL